MGQSGGWKRGIKPHRDDLERAEMALGQSGGRTYDVWDDTIRGPQLIAKAVEWPRVIDAINDAGCMFTPVDLRERVDASDLALVWAGFTIQRTSRGQSV